MNAVHLGHYNTSSTRTHVRLLFSTHAAAGGNVAPNSAFENSDIRIYRAAGGADISATQRSSSAGVTMTSPFDSLTGVHCVDIDLADNTDSGFYAAGYLYAVVLAPDETVDSQTITGVVLAYFEIGPREVDVRQWLGTAAATPTVAGVPEVDLTHWLGTAAATPTVAGVPEVDLTHVSGAAVTGGTPNVNVTSFSGDADTLLDAIKAVTDLFVAAHAEPTGVPAANETPLDKLAYLFMALRNKVTVTATKKTFFDDGDAAEWEKDLSDDGTTYTESEGNAI